MEQRLSLVTLGVASVPEARAFYERLGWTASPASQGEDVAFFQLNGLALSLYRRDHLAADARVPDSAPGFSGVTLAHNLRSADAVDALFDRAVAAGGKPVKRPERAFWGGYSGYVADPDGHLWELAFNPHFPLDEAGDLSLPG